MQLLHTECTVNIVSTLYVQDLANFKPKRCCCSAYLSSCHQTVSDAKLLDDPLTFHYQDYFVIGGIRTCLGVSNVPVNFFKFLSIEFAACSKPPSRDNHRKVSYPWTQQREQSAG